MGDRASIANHIDPDKPPVYYYTHWYGSKLPKTIQSALRRRERWTDGAYLARIIFCELILGKEREAEGFGISPYKIEGEHPTIHIHYKQQNIIIDGDQWSFDDFVLMDIDDIKY